jgi:hypothetical protein
MTTTNTRTAVTPLDAQILAVEALLAAVPHTRDAVTAADLRSSVVVQTATSPQVWQIGAAA